MPLTQKEEILGAFDDVWSHKWESFTRISDDLTDEEARFVHPVYFDAEPDPGAPTAGSILWQLSHLEYCYRYYTDLLNAIPNQPSEVEATNPSTVEQALAQLRSSREALRERIVKLPDEAFDLKVYNGDTVAQFIRMVTRHDAWHSSQIAIARRLYRNRDK